MSEAKIKELKQQHLFNCVFKKTGEVEQTYRDGYLVNFNGIAIFLQKGDFKKIS